MNDVHLQRVSDRIEKLVFSFCAKHVEFHMQDLTDWVRAKIQIAPDSAGRILRAMKAKGLVDYEIINRRASLYRIRNIQAQGALF
jgi:hypothetical protein